VQFLLHPFERWDVLIGGLGQHFSTHSVYTPASGKAPTSSTASQTLWVPRAALTYKLVANEGPTLTDARTYFSYSKGVLPNEGIFDAQGNALTSPQENRSYELGLKTTWMRRLDASIDVFHSYITNVPTKTYIFNGMGGNFSQTLGGKNTYDGGDLQIIGKVLPGWNVNLGYSFTKALLEDGRLPYKIYVQNQPKQQALLFTSYEFLGGPLRGLLGGVGVVWKEDVHLVANPQYIQTCGCNVNNQLPFTATRVDFRLSYQVVQGPLRGLSFFGNVYNAFNAKFYNQHSGDPRFSVTIGDPRTIRGGVSYSF
jgi:outer membrane receptor for ferric coprogen and ferric-rhodotorulic acid